MNKGRVKKIRKLCRTQAFQTADDYNIAYKKMKRARHTTNNRPNSLPATKRHKGEDMFFFKKRRAKVNEAKRLRKKTGIKWTRPES